MEPLQIQMMNFQLKIQNILINVNTLHVHTKACKTEFLLDFIYFLISFKIILLPVSEFGYENTCIYFLYFLRDVRTFLTNDDYFYHL